MTVKSRHWGRWMRDLFSSISIPGHLAHILRAMFFYILASLLSRSSCSPSPVQCTVYHSFELSCYQRKQEEEEEEEIHYSIWTRGIWDLDDLNWRHKNKIILNASGYLYLLYNLENQSLVFLFLHLLLETLISYLYREEWGWFFISL
jgi:hypothetical protein